MTISKATKRQLEMKEERVGRKEGKRVDITPAHSLYSVFIKASPTTVIVRREMNTAP